MSIRFIIQMQKVRYLRNLYYKFWANIYIIMEFYANSYFVQNWIVCLKKSSSGKCVLKIIKISVVLSFFQNLWIHLELDKV